MARALALQAFLLLAGLALSQAYNDPGALYLDTLLFDKVIDGSKDIVVRFDREYAWGETHDAFKAVAKRVGESSAPVIVAALPISKREYEKDAAQLAERYGVKEDDWPVYKLFKKGMRAGKDTPIEFKGNKKSSDEIVQWISTHTGAFFGLKGQVQALDALARKADTKQDEKARAALHKQATKLLGSIKDEKEKAHAEYYVRVFEKMVKAPDHVTKERARLRKILEDKAVTADKKEGFQIKLNALASFPADA